VAAAGTAKPGAPERGQAKQGAAAPAAPQGAEPGRGAPTPAPAEQAAVEPSRPAPASATGREFDRGAAIAALGAAAGVAAGCGSAGGPTGSGRVKVLFAPSGQVTSVAHENPQFAGTSVGNCVVAAFRSASVPRFDGVAVSVTKSFTVR
jgi:hypothetical protein